MGDIADAMIDGELCQECGTYMGDACGYPRSCLDCMNGGGNHKALVKKSTGLEKQERVKCSCGRWIAPRGMQTHIAHYHVKNGYPEKS